MSDYTSITVYTCTLSHKWPHGNSVTTLYSDAYPDSTPVAVTAEGVTSDALPFGGMERGYIALEL